MSAALVFLLRRAFSQMPVILVNWLQPPSSMALFGLLYTAFDKWVWRLRVLRTFGIVRVPDLNGEWQGKGLSSFDNEEFLVNVRITQTWTKLAVVVETDTSRSRSMGAWFSVQQPAPSLTYEYHNDPKPVSSAQTMSPHRGTALLWIKDNGSVMEGEYYTDGNRREFGELHLTKVA